MNVLNVALILISVSCIRANAEEPTPVSVDAAKKTSPINSAPVNTDYEVDYEGDAGATDANSETMGDAPVIAPNEQLSKKKNKKNQVTSNKQFDGSRAGNRSDMMVVPGPLKSRYKKNGVPLDVDTD